MTYQKLLKSATLKILFIFFIFSILLFASENSFAASIINPDSNSSIVETLFNKFKPSVVHIETVGVITLKNGAIMPEEEIGTGFFIDKNGDILTNFHVVGIANSIFVSFLNYKNVKASVVGTNPSTDLAIIHINPKGRTIVPVKMGDSGTLKVGERVIAIGNPYNLYQTVTTGIISGLKRSLFFPSSRFYGNIIQTDASINPGNSGGPLIDYNGDVIGINTAKLSNNAENIGFAIPINLAKKDIPALIKYGRIIRPWLGVEAIKLTPELATLLGIKNAAKGILVEKVFQGSPAYDSDVRAGKRIIIMKNATYVVGGDIITRINNQRIYSFSNFEKLIHTFSPGEVITLKVHRGKEIKLIKVRLARVP